MKFLLKRKTSRNDLNEKVKRGNNILEIKSSNSFKNLSLVFLNEFDLIYTLINS
jgi:hypothetical protein